MHSINLSAAWEATDADSDGRPVRVDLPRDWSSVSWPAGLPPVRLRLLRRFGRPARLPADTPARLRLGGFAGLAAIAINGEPAAVCEEGGFHAVGPFLLLARNVLTIEVDFPKAVAAGQGWGRAASLELPDF